MVAAARARARFCVVLLQAVLLGCSLKFAGARDVQKTIGGKVSRVERRNVSLTGSELSAMKVEIEMFFLFYTLHLCVDHQWRCVCGV